MKLLLEDRIERRNVIEATIAGVLRLIVHQHTQGVIENSRFNSKLPVQASMHYERAALLNGV